METTDSFRLIPLRIIQEGRKMNWERVRLARGGWRPARHIFVRKCGARRVAERPGPPPHCFGAITRSRSPDIPKLPFVATHRAHWRSLAQRAEIVQPMVGNFFVTRNRCKHWPKCVSGAFLSSMFSAFSTTDGTDFTDAQLWKTG